MDFIDTVMLTINVMVVVVTIGMVAAFFVMWKE